MMDDDEQHNDAHHEKEEDYKEKYREALEDASHLEIKLDRFRRELEAVTTEMKELSATNRDLRNEVARLKRERRAQKDVDEEDDVDVKKRSAKSTESVQVDRIRFLNRSLRFAETQLMIMCDRESRQRYARKADMDNLKSTFERDGERDRIMSDFNESTDDVEDGANRMAKDGIDDKDMRDVERRRRLNESCRRSGWLLKTTWWDRSSTRSEVERASPVTRLARRLSSSSPSTPLWNKVTGVATRVLRPQRRRYFVLDDCSSTLRYFLEEPPPNWRDRDVEKGTIPLTDVADVSLSEGIKSAPSTERNDDHKRPASSKKSTGLCFKLVTRNGRVYHFQASSKVECTKWMMDIVDCMRGVNTSGVSSVGTTLDVVEEDDSSESDDEEIMAALTLAAEKEAEKQRRELKRLVSVVTNDEKVDLPSSNSTRRTEVELLSQEAKDAFKRSSYTGLNEVDDRSRIRRSSFTMRMYELNTVVLWPKSFHRVEVPASGAKIVRWSFTSKSYDLAFEVRFLADNAERDAKPSLHMARVPCHQVPQRGSMESPPDKDGRGCFVFTWSNMYSRLRSKELTYRIEIG